MKQLANRRVINIGLSARLAVRCAAAGVGVRPCNLCLHIGFHCFKAGNESVCFDAFGDLGVKRLSVGVFWDL